MTSNLLAGGLVVWLLAMAALYGAAPARADEPPILRYTSYVILETAGKPARVEFESRPYGAAHADYTYKDQPSFAVIGADGQTYDDVCASLGARLAVNVPAAVGPFALIEARPGNNYCLARPDGPYGFVATEAAPLNVVNGFERLYFYVPRGADGGTFFFHAFSVGEAARVLIHDPDGRLVYENEDDFNTPGAVSFQVREGQDGKVWSLSLAAPKNPAWKLDDCKLWMGGTLPGVLSPRPDWAERLSRPFAAEWRRVWDFESETPVATTQWDQAGEKEAAAPAFKLSLSAEQARSGKQSLRIEMKLPEKDAGRNQLKIFLKEIPASGLDRVKFWLYGDGSGRKLVVRARDQGNEHHYCNVGEVLWKGWGEVVADFKHGDVVARGGDGNMKIDGPKISLVLQIGHEPGQPAEAVYYVDDVAVSP